MSTDVATIRVKAVQEPGYTNVWYVQDVATGLTVAHVPINDHAKAWANRIADALNGQLTG